MHRTIGAIAALLLVFSAQQAAAAPNVVTSIKPIHSLVAAVMADVGESQLLIDGGGSPHAYSMKPSQARALQEADVVFWIGKDLEAFLERPLAALSASSRVVALHAASGISLLAYREGGAWEAHEDEHESASGHDHGHAHHDDEADKSNGGNGHHHGEHDVHVWLNPLNAQAMVATIALTLSDVDPANSARYQENAAALSHRLDELDARLREKLAPIQGRRYIVFHDAYHYFENRYGLTPVGSITISPERQPSAARIFEIRRKILDTDARCVFAEPQFEPAIVKTVTEATSARVGTLDPLGASLTSGPDAYFELLSNLAESLRRCLQPDS